MIVIFLLFDFPSRSASATDCRLVSGRISFHQFRTTQGLEWRHKDIHPNSRQSMRNAGGMSMIDIYYSRQSECLLVKCKDGIVRLPGLSAHVTFAYVKFNKAVHLKWP